MSDSLRPHESQHTRPPCSSPSPGIYPLTINLYLLTIWTMGFPHSSVSKSSACHAGDPGLIPGLGRCPGKGNGNLVQCSFLENPMGRAAWRATVHGVARVRHDLATKTTKTIWTTYPDWLYNKWCSIDSRSSHDLHTHQGRNLNPWYTSKWAICSCVVVTITACFPFVRDSSPRKVRLACLLTWQAPTF